MEWLSVMFTIGTCIWQFLAQSSATNKARFEARDLANQQRKDTITVNTQTSELADKTTQLNQQKIDFNKQMFGENQKDIKQSEQDMLAEGKRASILTGMDAMNKNGQVNSYLANKVSAINRWSF
jgi:hypothetical protein